MTVLLLEAPAIVKHTVPVASVSARTVFVAQSTVAGNTLQAGLPFCDWAITMSLQHRAKSMMTVLLAMGWGGL